MGIRFIKTITIISLLCIILSQFVWTMNLYNTNLENLKVSIERDFDSAIMSEYAYRNELSGGWVKFGPHLLGQNDTTRYITKTIRSIDTTYTITIDRYDGYSIQKITQFLLKDDYPININKVDSLFRKSLQLEYPQINNTYIDYIDLEKDDLISTNRSKKEGRYIESDLYVLDITNSIAVKAYVENPFYVVLNRMLFQLMLSCILIAICFYSIFYLLRSFLYQKKAEEMRQSAISAMTHEFKRPISSAVAQISLIPFYLERKDTSKVSKYAENTMLELKKLTLYTERIQRISKDNNTRLMLDYQDVVLCDFIERISDKYSNISDKKVTFVVTNKTTRSSVKMDLLHMSNVIDNLIENAIKYSEKELTLEVEFLERESDLVIKVKDNGIGMSKLDKKYIFEKFYRSPDISSYKKTGFGLGLTYCKLVVNEHGGTIDVNSELGIGSEFIVTIPII